MVKMSVATAKEQVTNPLLRKAFFFFVVVPLQMGVKKQQQQKKQIFVLCEAFLKSPPS